MKFEKFLKSLGGHGVIYTKGADRWLATTTVLAKIPDNMLGVIAEKVVEMPEGLRCFIDNDVSNDPCELLKAVMPIADSGIKDCVRIYATESGDVRIPICNDDYALIDRSDIKEINRKYDQVERKFEAKALVIREFNANPDEDAEIVGIIFPVTNFKEDM